MGEMRTPIRDEITERLEQAVANKNARHRAVNEGYAPTDEETRAVQGLCAEYLTAKILAKRWATSEYYLYKLRVAGTGPPFLRIGRVGIRYSLVAVEEFERGATFQKMSQVYAADPKRRHDVLRSQRALAKGRAASREARGTG
jgi:hypothetical protein